MPIAPARLLPAVAGFALMGGLLPLGLMAVVLQPAPPLPWAVEEVAPVVEAPEVKRIYIEIETPFSVSLGPQAALVEANLAFGLRGEVLALAELQKTVDAQMARINAVLLAETQAMVLEGMDSAALHKVLPERLRGVINGMLGTEDWPEPVEEVMLIELVMQ